MCKFLSEKYKCKSNKYDSYLKNLPAINLSFKVPKNARLLFFGTSMVGQLVDVLLCANNVTSAIDHRNFMNLENRFSYENKGLLPKVCNPACATHEFATFYLHDNASVTSVVNWPHLQRFSLKSNFNDFLQKGKFTYVFFMIPHKECFFDWLKAKHKPFCINTNHNYVPPSKYVKAYTKVLENQSINYNTLIPWNQIQSYNEKNSIYLYEVLRKFGMCNTPSCTLHSYHQCIPGPLSFVLGHVLSVLEI